MAVTTKILFPATSNSTTTDFSLSGLQLNNQDDLDVYVTKTTAGIAANNPKAVANNASAIPGATIAKLVFLDIAID